MWEMLTILTVVMVSEAYTHIETYKTVYFKYMELTACQ